MSKFEFEIQMWCDKHNIEYWLDSAVPVKKRGCPKCIEEKKKVYAPNLPSSLRVAR